MKQKSIKPSKIKALLTKIGVGVVALGLVAMTVTYAVKYNAAQTNGVQLSEDLAAVNANFDALNLSSSSTISNLTDKYNEALKAYNLSLVEMTADSVAKDAVIEDYKATIEELKAESAASADTAFDGFSKDELSLDFDSTFTVDNNDLAKLGKYKIDFDGDDIKVDETLEFNGAFASNDKDFDGETMYKLSDGDLLYKVSFDEDMSALNYSKDSVDFSFLGEDKTVTAWSSNSVTFDTNKEELANEGDVLNGVELVKVGENAVLLKYNDELQSVKEGDSYNFKDIEVKVNSIFYTDNLADNSAVLTVAEDLDTTIVNGDEYEPNDNYEWAITSDSIALKLVEDFDEDDTALTEGNNFMLPNDFAALSFELSKEDMNKVDVEYKAADEVKFKGDFEDAEGDVVFNGTAFVDSNDDVYSTLLLKDSDYEVSFNGHKFVVGDIKFSKDITSLKVNGEDMTDEDVDVKSNIGIEISAPKDDLEDGELSFEVPEESIEATLKVE